MGWALPLTLNKMIKKDVDNYVKNNTTSQSNNNYSMEARRVHCNAPNQKARISISCRI